MLYPSLLLTVLDPFPFSSFPSLSLLSPLSPFSLLCLARQETATVPAAAPAAAAAAASAASASAGSASGRTTPAPEPEHVCATCARVFGSRQALSAHSRYHVTPAATATTTASPTSQPVSSSLASAASGSAGGSIGGAAGTSAARAKRRGGADDDASDDGSAADAKSAVRVVLGRVWACLGLGWNRDWDALNISCLNVSVSEIGTGVRCVLCVWMGVGFGTGVWTFPCVLGSARCSSRLPHSSTWIVLPLQKRRDGATPAKRASRLGSSEADSGRT